MLLNLTEISVAICLLISLPQVHSRLRSSQDTESKDLHSLDQEGEHLSAATTVKRNSASPLRVNDNFIRATKDDIHAYNTEMFSYNYNYNYDYNYGAKLITDNLSVEEIENKRNAHVPGIGARATTHEIEEIDTAVEVKTTSVSTAENSRGFYEFADATVKRHRAAKKNRQSHTEQGVFSYNYGYGNRNVYGYESRNNYGKRSGYGSGYRKLSDYTVAKHKSILSDLPLSKAAGGDLRSRRKVKRGAVPPLISPTPPLISPVPPATKPGPPLPKPEPPMHKPQPPVGILEPPVDVPMPPMAMPMPVMPKRTPLPPRIVPPPLAALFVSNPILDTLSSASQRETLIVFEPIPVPVPILDPQIAMPMPVMTMPKPAPDPSMTQPEPPMGKPTKPKKGPKPPPGSAPEPVETVSPSAATTASPSDG